MKRFLKQKATLQVLPLIIATIGCKTVETGGKVVDRSRGEIVISSASDQRSALPDSASNESFTKTRVKLENALEKDPGNIESLLSLAQMQLVQDQFKDSEATCQKILRQDLKNQEAKKILAQIAIRQDNPDLALIFISALGGEDSKDSSVLNMLGLISFNKGDTSDSMRLWKKALTLNANDISVRMNLGVSYLKYRLIGQASAHFERILKVAPHHQDAKLHLAIIDASKGSHEKAMAVYNEILSQNKDNPIARFNLALSQKALTQYDDALDSLKLYIKSSPQKSSQTDQAFAIIEEINTLKASKGEKVSDEDIRRLAANLETKKVTAREDRSTGAKKETATKQAPAAQQAEVKKPENVEQAAKKSDLGEDKDIDDLERELRAH